MPDGRSSLEEEDRFRQQMLADDLSPGAFRDGERVVCRVYADRTATGRNGGAVLPSRFTAARLAELRRQLVALTEQGLHFAVYYDAVSDRLAVTGNLPQARLPGDAVAKGEIRYEYSDDGGRGS